MRSTRLVKTAGLFLPCLFASILLISCHPEPVVPQDSRVLILDPPAESTTGEREITITAFVERFDIVDGTGRVNTPGEGHLVYYMDVVPLIEKGASAITSESTCAISMDTSYTWEAVQPGDHTFWVQLVNNDNTPLEPPAAVRVYVTVR